MKKRVPQVYWYPCILDWKKSIFKVIFPLNDLSNLVDTIKALKILAS